MKRRKKSKYTSGSATILVIALLASLLIFFGVFLSFSTNRHHVSKKLSNVLYARDFSFSLALLATHQIKEKFLIDTNNLLVKELSKPLTKLSDSKKEKLVFEPFLLDTIKKLIDNNSELRDLQYSIHWEIKKNDFASFSQAYTREKQGIIRLPIEIKYKIPASDAYHTESYLYSLRVKVTANFIPVLSKFTLYVEDALSGADSERLNLLTNDEYGKLHSSSNIRPWIINNGLEGVSFPNRFNEAIESKRGLVYLGGGDITLGISRAWAPPGEYSEGFHLLGEGRGQGFYTIDKIGSSLYVVAMETGLCDTDSSDNDAIFWHELIQGGYEHLATKASFLKLYGSDQNKAPTIVFGNVKARTIRGKAFKDVSTGFRAALPYAYSDAQYADYCSGLSEDFDISYFAEQHNTNIGTLDRSLYNSKYASDIIEVPYNRGLGYIITNYQNNFPLESGIIDSSLASWLNGSNANVAHRIPAPFDTIYSDLSDLRKIEDFLADERTNFSKKAMTTIRLASGESIYDALERTNFLKQNDLSINAWIFLESDTDIVFDRALNLITHGGIILKEGNIRVNNLIAASSGNLLLNLVALNGNIIIDDSLGGDLNIGLTACGQASDSGSVIFYGNRDSIVPTIIGNVAMQKFGNGSIEYLVSRGVRITYNTDLSALPNSSVDDTSEQPLLMFGVEYPRLVE